MSETINIELKGRIDSTNSPELEKTIMSQIEGSQADTVVFDASNLEYISSAGLRILLRVRKTGKKVEITGVSSEVYEILEMTGFTEMVTVEKQYRQVSVEGCEEIGRGANGTVYRIDSDNVVKVYKDANALDEIKHEREVARLALILDIPTAISYDVVKVGNSYGSVFELLNSSSFSKILAESPEKYEWCVREFANLLRKIHQTVVPKGKLPSMKERVCGYVDFLNGHIPDEDEAKLKKLMDGIPEDDHMIHGDYHTRNVVFQNDEVLLIDMDTLAVGNPVFELAFMFNAFVGFYELAEGTCNDVLGLSQEEAGRFWRMSLAAYLQTDDEARLNEVENKARILGYVRLIRRNIRRELFKDRIGGIQLDNWKKELSELLKETDSLTF